MEPAPRIKPRIDTIALTGARDIEEQHAILCCSLRELIVELRDHPRRRSWNQPVVVAEYRFGDVKKRLLNNRRVEILASFPPQQAYLIDQLGNRLVDFRGWCRKWQVGKPPLCGY